MYSDYFFWKLGDDIIAYHCAQQPVIRHWKVFYVCFLKMSLGQLLWHNTL